MRNFNRVIESIEEELKNHDTVTYRTAIKTAEDNESWLVTVMNFLSCPSVEVEINYFEYNDIVEMRISKKTLKNLL